MATKNAKTSKAASKKKTAKKKKTTAAPPPPAPEVTKDTDLDAKTAAVEESKKTSLVGGAPPPPPAPEESRETDAEAVERLTSSFEKLRQEIGKVIVGQQRVVDELLIAIFTRGHCIIEGVPGLAKTLLIRTLARCLHLEYNRIQFTPDLMPADITGTEVISEDRVSGERSFRFLKGPIFANIILADEINRTPPKTQAALLESMQERQVTIGGERHPLPDPFFVLATQNPIEQEGTYPLPEAQQDRFIFKIYIKYPQWDEEYNIIRQTTEELDPQVKPVFGAEDIHRIQRIVRRVPIADPVVNYVMRLVRRTRRDGTEGEPVPEVVKEYVAWGAGPRACQGLVTAGKAKALLAGRYHVSIEDIKSVAHPVLRHRILTNFHAEARGYTPDRIVDILLEETPTEQGAALENAQVRKILRS